MSINLEKENAIQTLNLRKQKLGVCLEKKVFNNVMSRVAVVMDKSGSMRSLYKNRTVQNVLERFFPLALKFDDNGELDVWLFHNEARRISSVTESNFYNYVDEVILKGPYANEWKATSYAPPIKDIMNKYIVEEPSNIPTFVIFVTDGNNDDKKETKKMIIEASGHNIFWQFIGIGNEKFNFLKKLDELDGRTVDNANFFAIENLESLSDTDLYDLLLNEYPQWQKEAKKLGIIK